jgi:hypothetical protein
VTLHSYFCQRWVPAAARITLLAWYADSFWIQAGFEELGSRVRSWLAGESQRPGRPLLVLGFGGKLGRKVANRTGGGNDVLAIEPHFNNCNYYSESRPLLTRQRQALQSCRVS